MTETTWFILAIIIYMAAMLAIGFWSYRQTDKYGDYVLADRKLNPFIAAMSAGASDMSGWLLMGLPGALYVSGMTELWIAIGLTIGAWLNWKFVAPRLRAYSEVAKDSITIPSFFGNRLQDESRVLRVCAALIIIFFFTFYVSSGMVSGGKYFEATFGGNYLDGMLIVAGVTVMYTFIGGFLAVSYTDSVQGMIMFAALLLVPIIAFLSLDHPSDIVTWASSNAYGPWENGNPQYFSFFAGVSAFAVIGNLAWGFGYFGQPHVVVRFMALRSPQEAKEGRRIGIGWMVLCMLGALATAMISTVFFAQTDYGITDTESYETIFLDLGRILFHPLVAGLVLTAVLAAIMSTMSSQLLVVSSSLIEDLYKLLARSAPAERILINLSRTTVILVAVVAGVLAIHPSDTILNLVGFAWAGFGAAFGPLMLASLYWKRLTTAGALSGMLTGAVVVLAWGYSPLADVLYEMVPGVLASSLVMVVVSLMTRAPSSSVVKEFEQVEERVTRNEN